MSDSTLKVVPHPKLATLPGLKAHVDQLAAKPRGDEERERDVCGLVRMAYAGLKEMEANSFTEYLLAADIGLPEKLIKGFAAGAREEIAAEAVVVTPHSDNKHYWILKKVGKAQMPSPISTFIIRATAHAKYAGKTITIATLMQGEKVLQRNVVFDASAWHSSIKFKQTFNADGAAWWGNDGHVQQIKYLVGIQNAPEIAGARGVGWARTLDGQPRWVTTTGVLGADGQKYTDVIHMPHAATITNQVAYKKGNPGAAAEALPLLLELNEPQVILPLVGGVFAGLLRPEIIKRHGGFPITMLLGNEGVGKTTLMQEALWPLVGVANSEAYLAHTCTLFTLVNLLTETTTVPVFIDEYRKKAGAREEGRRQSLESVLRAAYNNTKVPRGTADQNVVEYPLTAPVVLAGESLPDDPALRERLLVTTFDKNALAKGSKYVAAHARLQKLHIEHLAHPLVCFALGLDGSVPQRLTAAEKIVDARLQTAHVELRIPARVRKSLAVMVLGVQMYTDFCTHMSVALPAMEQHIDAAISHSVASLFEGSTQPRSQLDSFVEALSVMAQIDAGKETQGTEEMELTFSRVLPLGCRAVEGHLLYLHLPTAYSAYLEHQARTREGDKTQGLSALRRTARENHKAGWYVREYNRLKKIAGRAQKTIVIDLTAAAKTGLDVGGFLCMDEQIKQTMIDDVPDTNVACVACVAAEPEFPADL